MAKASIGELNVKVSADSKGFAATLSEAEKQLSAFAAKAATPFALGFGAAGVISRPMETLLGPIERLTEIIPGLEKYSFFFNPGKYSAAMTEVKDTTLALARSAQQLNIEPQFLKAVQLAAGPLADEMVPALQKLLTFQQQLRSGDASAAEKATKWFGDPELIANMSAQDFIGTFADRMKRAKEEGQEFAVVADLIGKRAGHVTNAFAQGSEAIDKWVNTLKEMGIDPKLMTDMARVVAWLEKLEKLEAENVRNREFMERGGPRMGARLGMAQANTPLQFLQEFGRYAQTLPPWAKAFLSTMGGPAFFFAGTSRLGPSPKFLEMLKNAPGEPGPPPEIEFETEADKANTALDKLNDSLDKQEEALRLADLGWGNLANSVMAVDEAFANGADIDKVTAALKRLNEMRDEAAAKKAAEEQEKSIRQAISGFKGAGAEFAPVALAGSAEAAAAVNRQFAGTGIADLLPTAEQIRDIVKRQEARAVEVNNLVRDVRGLLGGEIGPVTD